MRHILVDNRHYFSYSSKESNLAPKGRRPLMWAAGASAVLRDGGRQPEREPRWSAGRRRAPEAGGSRKRIVLWRAPRPKRERVVTSVRVARPTTLAPPGAPFLPFGEAFRDACSKARTLTRRENVVARCVTRCAFALPALRARAFLVLACRIEPSRGPDLVIVSMAGRTPRAYSPGIVPSLKESPWSSPPLTSRRLLHSSPAF